jgi:hypothetical protein
MAGFCNRVNQNNYQVQKVWVNLHKVTNSGNMLIALFADIA